MSRTQEREPSPHRSRGRAGLISAIWVLGLVVVIVVPVAVGTTLYNQVIVAALTRAHKSSLHLVESQLQLEDIGQVQVKREFDNTAVWGLSTGGQSMEADISVAGANVPDRLAARFRALGYTNRINPTRWDLGLSTLYVTPTDTGADVQLEVSAGD
ncbi:hypothetical protein ABH923_001981 [Leifsonia sp. EB41]|uniref:hypothetical protein n=1 Tax=Leifsonia sp. EB41 TaxID=3156260 RepID=UPI0035143C43